MRRPCTALFPLLALALALSACGGDDEREDKAAATDPRTATDEVRTEGTTPERRDVAGARREVAEQRQRARDLKQLREEDREFDRAFETSRFDRLVFRLPIRKPPLHVEQYITGDDHRIHAAVSRKRFCRLRPARRERAVASFFESAVRIFRRGKVNDLEVVVTPVSERIDKLPALATARRGHVRLTSRGRSC